MNWFLALCNRIKIKLPVFQDSQEHSRRARLLAGILIVFIAILILFIIGLWIFAPEVSPLSALLVPAILLSAACLYAVQRGYVDTAASVFVFMAWILNFLVVVASEHGNRLGLNGFPTMIMLGSLLVGKRTGLWLTGASILAVLGLQFNLYEFIPSLIVHTPAFEYIPTVINLSLLGGMLYILVGSLENALQAARNSEGALRQKEAQYHSVFETITDGLIITDPDTGKLIDVNPAAYKMHGYTREEFLALTPEAFIDAEGFARYDDYNTTVRAGRLLHGEGRNIRRDGSLFDVEVIGVAYPLGDKTYTLGVLRDISERKRAEAVLHENENSLKEAQRIAHLGSFEFDLLSHKVNWSDEVYRIFGLPVGTEITLEHYQRLLEPSVVDMVMGAVEQAIISGTPYQFEHGIILPDGTKKHVFATGRPVRDPAGKIVKIFGTVQDVTERKAVEEALLQSEQMLQIVLNTIPVRLFWKDRNSVYLGCNQRFAQDAGRSSPSEMIGLTDDKLYPLEAELYRADDIHVIQTQQERLNYEEPLTTPNGAKLWLRTSKVPLRNLAGEVIGVLGTYEDITERKQAELALEESRQQSLQMQTYLQTLYEMSIELTSIDSLDELYRRAVELGIQRLGFDRIGLYRYDAERNMALGKWGTDTQGNLRREDHLQFVVMPGGIMSESLNNVGRYRMLMDHPLFHDFQVVGRGWSVGVALWHNGQNLGWLMADNLINQQPPQPMQLEVFAQYGVLLAAAIARRETDEALRRRDLQYRALFDNTNDAVTLIDLDGMIIGANSRCADLFGIPIESLIGTSAFCWINPDSRDDATDKLGALTNDQYIPLYERTLRRPDGGHRYVEINAALVRDPEGKPVHIQSVMRDITTRKQNEQALKISEERMMLSARVGKIGIFDHDHVTDHIYWSPEHRVIYGYGMDEPVVLNSGRDVIHPDDADRIHQAVLAAWDPNGTGDFDVEYRIINRRGELRWISTRARTFFDGEGSSRRPVRTIGAVIDITESKQMEEALRRTEQQYRTLAQNLPGMAIVLFKPDGVVEVAEGSELPHVGYPKESIEGRHLSEIVPLEQFEGYNALLEQALQHGMFSREMLYGGEIYNSTYVPLYDDGGSVNRILNVIQNITLQKEAEEALRQFNQELELRVVERTRQLQAINKELEAFAYSVSHDLRAPLRSIDGFSQALLEDYYDQFDETGRDYLNRVRRNSQRMGDLIDDMLTLSRISRNEMNLELVDLSALAHDVAQELSQTDPQRAVDWEIAPDLSAQCDARLLRVVLVNLLGNAWKFTRKRELAIIRFEQTQHEGQLCFVVRDNGVGFDMQYVDKLFGAFQRLHPTSEFEGTGIGLATVQRVIQRHGGHAWAEGEEGIGASFYFSLSNDTF
jgi:PAS domain S-box-containing protein